MKKLIYFATSLVGVLAIGVTSLHAQTVMTTMPTLYNQNGAVVNAGVGPLVSGYYYIGGGPAQGGHEVDYYGNGVYYDITNQVYGGSVSDPSGMAGVSLNSVAPATAAIGVPNTGLGGMALSNWLILIISGAAFVASVVYSIASAAI